MFKPQVYKSRREHLRKLLGEGVYLFLGNNESPMNYRDNTYHFRQDSTFLYFFGLDLPGMAAIIDTEKNKEIIFANDVDIDDIIWMGPQPSVKEIAQKCLISETYPFAKLYDYLKEALKKKRKVHFLPPYRHDNMILLNDLMGINISELKTKASVEFLKAIIQLRNVKEDVEIEEIEKACNIGYLMHTTAMKMAKPGVVEREIAGYIEGISISHGAVPSFPVILTTNGQTLHNHCHDNILKKGDLMLTDAGAQTTMFYASDNTRTVPVGGKFSTKQKEIYQVVLNAINGSIKLMKPGIKYFDVHLAACEIIASGLKDLGIMKGNTKEAVRLGAHALFMPHGLGHMMGLDVHDLEDLGQIYVGYDDVTRPSNIFGTAFLRMGRELKTGYVLTNEPGIYFIPELIDLWKKDKKFQEFINYDKVEGYRSFGGIRLEDDILITDKGSRILGDKRIPISVDEVETIMK
ncbi:MAG TPA: aminopeptidase P family protein [Bacteroidales bacterium]|nr:aminopeptidase P family protein [Bacteroidales bacterium]